MKSGNIALSIGLLFFLLSVGYQIRYTETVDRYFEKDNVYYLVITEGNPFTGRQIQECVKIDEKDGWVKYRWLGIPNWERWAKYKESDKFYSDYIKLVKEVK